MTVAEKLELMEVIWEDLAKSAEEIPSPKWHDEVLAEVDRRIAAGEETFRDWEEVKVELLSELHDRQD